MSGQARHRQCGHPQGVGTCHKLLSQDWEESLALSGFNLNICRGSRFIALGLSIPSTLLVVSDQPSAPLCPNTSSVTQG